MRLVGPHNDYRVGDDRSPGPLPSATVVIPVFNRVELLTKTLAGLCAQTVAAAVVVVDDGSTEDVVSAVRPFANRLDLDVIHQPHSGYGAGRARNRGAQRAETDVVVFIDADCIPAPDLVERHVSHHHFENVSVIGSRRHVAAAGIDVAALAAGTVDFEALAVDESVNDFRTTLARRMAELTAGTEAYRAFVSSNVSVNRELFAETGGFSPDFARWGGEDTELGWRLQQVGGYFIPADDAVVYHQVDVDGPEGWRSVERHQNDGIIITKIPHRFYRKRGGVIRHEVPKVSFVVFPIPASDIETLVEDLLSSSLRDVEVILPGDPDDHQPFAGSISGDSRVNFVPDDEDGVARAIRSSQGELVILLHGDVAPDRRLAARAAKRMDERPRISSMTVGYRVFQSIDEKRPVDWSDHLRSDDPPTVDRAWNRVTPLAAIARKRDLMRALASGMSPDEAWTTIRSWDIADHMAQPLAWVPGPRVTARPPGFRVRPEDRDDVKALLRKRRPIDAVRHGVALVRRRPHPRTAPPGPAPEPSQSRPPHLPELRYVGWTGRDNLGDEAMLLATCRLMPWANIVTSGDPVDGLLLGGGTLINRTTYLRWLRERDSPRVERVIFGTGVASPAFWGLTEDVHGWLDYLTSCAYVGVRGPDSAETLRNWGYRGPLDQVGDPALALAVDRPDQPTEGRVLVAPAWTKGELWGGSDADVYRNLTEAVRGWLAAGREVEFFSCHPDDDRPCIEIMRAANRPDLPHHFGYLDVDDALRVLSRAGVVVAERLHAAVLAAAVDRPFVAIEYRPKLADFARSVDAGDWVVRTDSLTPQILGELVDGAHQQQAAVRDRVEEYRRRLRSAAATVEGAVRQ